MEVRVVEIKNALDNAADAGLDEGALDGRLICAGSADTPGELPSTRQVPRRRSLLSRPAETIQRRSLFGR